VYGAFLKDDGGFASEGDEKVSPVRDLSAAFLWLIARDIVRRCLQFDQRFKGLHPDFGLRRIPDIERVAARYGFVLEKRISMPAGNWMLVFRRESGTVALQ
jgi:hypothetical protein